MGSDLTAVVTGAAGGIGYAIAQRLAEDGYHVWLLDQDEGGIEANTAALMEKGLLSRHVACDVTNKDSLQAAHDQIVAESGRVDVLAANAGVSSMRPFLELTEQDWQRNIDVNAKGAFLSLQIFGRTMTEQAVIKDRSVRGKIVVTASMAARQGAVLLAHYSASKFAVLGLVQAVAREFAPSQVLVNAVNPGWVRTPMQDREVGWEASLREMTADEVREEYVAHTPIGRLQEPEDVASVVSFLANKDSDFLTGEAIEANGGAFIF